MKKNYVIPAIVVVVVLLASGAGYFYFSNKTDPDSVFYNYVNKHLMLDQYAFTESAEGTGVMMSATGINDIKKKTYTVSVPLECTTKYNDSEVSINATIQLEGASSYLRLDKISGNYTNSDDTEFNLAKIYSKVKGQWYEIEDENLGVAALLDSGIAAYNSIIFAPAYDTEKLTAEIIDTKVFSYNSFSLNDNGNYVFQFVSNRNAYTALFENNLPNVSNVDLIMDTIFSDKSTFESTLTVGEDGTFISEQLLAPNLCPVLFDTYIGETAQGQAEEINSDSRSTDFSTVKFDPVTSSKPGDQMGKDITL